MRHRLQTQTEGVRVSEVGELRSSQGDKGKLKKKQAKKSEIVLKPDGEKRKNSLMNFQRCDISENHKLSGKTRKFDFLRSIH